jgi:hypothetical protein
MENFLIIFALSCALVGAITFAAALIDLKNINKK